MTNIKIKVVDASIEATADGKLTSGMIGIPVSIEYNSAWDGLIKTVSFRIGHFARSRENVSTATTVPWEVMRKHGKPLEVGVEGRDEDGNLVMPTCWTCVGIVCQGANSTIPGAPNPGDGDYGDNTHVLIDDTLSIKGAAADAKAVGDALGNVEAALDAIIAIQEELIGIITFTVNGNEYRAIDGMTWGAWVDSKYNIDGFTVDEGYVCDADVAGFHGPDGNLVTPNMVIIAGASYGS